MCTALACLLPLPVPRILKAKKVLRLRLEVFDKMRSEMLHRLVSSVLSEGMATLVVTVLVSPLFFVMCCIPEMQKWMYIRAA